MARECPQVDRAVQAVAVKPGVVLEDGQMCVYVYICIHTHTYVGYIAIGLFKQGRESLLKQNERPFFSSCAQLSGTRQSLVLPVEEWSKLSG